MGPGQTPDIKFWLATGHPGADDLPVAVVMVGPSLAIMGRIAFSMAAAITSESMRLSIPAYR